MHGTIKESLVAGNAAQMREALELASRVIHCAIEADILKGEDAWGAFYACRAALSAPPRNCDVGTASEQIKRWEEFCIAHHEYWKPPSTSLTAIQRCNCPCLEGNGCNYFIWSQMPYEEGVAK